jgi:hypothetical protein
MIVPLLDTVLAILALVAPPRAEPPASPDGAAWPVPFLDVIGAERRSSTTPDIWKVSEEPPPFGWMTASNPLHANADAAAAGTGEPFQEILERMASSDQGDRRSPGLPGVIADQGRWRYQQERSGDFYKRKTKLELPDPNEVWTPYAVRDWKAQEKVQIPVPMPLPAIEQVYVYGQLDGSGDALNNQRTSLYGKTGVGVKWLFLAGSEVQLRYATLLSYADELNAGRFQERAQPAVELMARMPIIGPLELEYSGSAIPALTRTDNDRLKQELRLALPLRGDNELEFGARYQWEYAPVSTPWFDRAQLFFGLKWRH